MRVYKAKIINYNTIKAVLECENCGAAEIILVPLEKDFKCNWCKETNIIDLETILKAEKGVETKDD